MNEKIFFFISLFVFQNCAFGQSYSKLLKDIDFDKVKDIVYIDYDKATLVCKLSSLNFKKIESSPIKSLTKQPDVSAYKDGFKYNNVWVKSGSGYSAQFRYNEEMKEIQLIGLNRYDFSNANDSYSVESSLNLLTNEYIGNWKYSNQKDDILRKIPSIKTKMYLSTISLNQFNEKPYNNYSDQCSKLFRRFKEIDINSRNHDLEKDDSNTTLYTKFKPDRLEKFHVTNFSIDHAYQLKGFKIISGNSEATDEKIVVPDTKTDWGDRLLVLDSENKVVYRSKGVGDVYLFEPHFYMNAKSNKIIIVCQLGYEYYFGGEVFIFKNGNIKYIGNLDIESSNEEKCLTDIIEINEKRNQIEFSFKENLLNLNPGSEDILINSDGLMYIYKTNKLTLVKR